MGVKDDAVDHDFTGIVDSVEHRRGLLTYSLTVPGDSGGLWTCVRHLDREIKWD
jgi:hypothetical protein